MASIPSVYGALDVNMFHVQPKHPTRSAFIRASTLSLGSIAFGSLIVAILETIKVLLRVAQANANADGHRACHNQHLLPDSPDSPISSAVEACLACCAACFLGCIEQLVEYFNRWGLRLLFLSVTLHHHADTLTLRSVRPVLLCTTDT
jgi:hypothetical protein